MGMNNRLLRPRASGYVAADADARAYIDAVRTADGQALENNVAKAIDTFVAGCKTDGTWTAIKACCILAGARTLAGALVPLVGAAPTNVNFVSGDYDRKNGLIGNGSTKYLDSGRNNNADPQDSKHLSVWRTTAATIDAGLIGSNGTSTGDSHIYTGFSSFIFRNNAATSSAESLNSTANIFLGTSRASGLEFTRRIATSTVTASVASQTPRSANIRVFETGGRTNARLAFYSIGEALNLSLLGSRVSTLISAIGAAIP